MLELKHVCCMAMLQPYSCRLINFLLIITLESFTASALGLAVGSVAPSRSAAQVPALPCSPRHFDDWSVKVSSLSSYVIYTSLLGPYQAV